jgi:hypothetical protein
MSKDGDFITKYDLIVNGYLRKPHGQTLSKEGTQGTPHVIVSDA